MYKSKPAVQYDFDNDPAGQIIWLRAAQQAVQNNPMQLALPRKPSAEDVKKVVLTICDKFKDQVENNALCSLLYDGTGEPKPEEAAQKLFYGIGDCYCEANNLDLTRECNAGRGPVDFKISSGYRGRVVVETKLSTNSQLLHGFETQVKEYQKAEKSKYAVYLVLDVVGGSSRRIRALKELIGEHKRQGQRVPDVIFINAIPKASASKF